MKVKLLGSKELRDFPSGSGIEFYNDQVYLIGVDAKEILVLSKKWKKLELIPVFESTEPRIPKKLKRDLEATTIVEINKIPRLLALSTGPSDQHSNAVLVNLDDHFKEIIEISEFLERLRAQLDHVHVEGAAVVLGKLVLGNRGHQSSPDNTMLVTDIDFWKHPQEAEITQIEFDLPEKSPKFLGISGMTYSHVNDWLICTLSSKDTPHAIDNGDTGDSYLAIVENASRKITRHKMKVNELINLSKVDDDFKGHKLESVCIVSEKNGRVRLHLKSEDDTGESYLFRIRLKG